MANAPEDSELGYREFVSCMIKIAIIDKTQDTGKGVALQKPGLSPGKATMKKMEVGNYREYNTQGLTADRVRAMFETLNVSGGVLSIIKEIDRKKLPPREPAADHHSIDYLKER